MLTFVIWIEIFIEQKYNQNFWGLINMMDIDKKPIIERFADIIESIFFALLIVIIVFFISLMFWEVVGSIE